MVTVHLELVTYPGNTTVLLGHAVNACLNVIASVFLRETKAATKITLASSVVTARCPARSALLPASAMIMLGLPCRCSSFTQFFALVKLSALVMSNTTTAAAAPLPKPSVIQSAMPIHDST